MKEKAIEKIRAEMKKDSNPYVQLVGNFLINHVENNPATAEKILAEDKTILKSLESMKKEAEKKKVGNCAVLTDQEGFAIVLRYFGLEPAGFPKSEEKKPALSAPRPAAKQAPLIDFDINLEDLL